MQEQINKLKKLRLEQIQATDQLEKATKLLEQSEEWQLVEQCKAYLAGVKEDLQETDDTIRVMAVEKYHEDGNKHPHEKVSIAINKVFSYSVDRAIQWAINNSLGMLKLDTKKFEKHARAVNDTLPLEFVEMTEEPGVRIASKL